MKWKSNWLLRTEEAAKKWALVDVPRKAFALFPTEMKSGYVIWLKPYFKVYRKVYARDFGHYLNEEFYETEQECLK